MRMKQTKRKNPLSKDMMIVSFKATLPITRRVKLVTGTHECPKNFTHDQVLESVRIAIKRQYRHLGELWGMNIIELKRIDAECPIDLLFLTKLLAAKQVIEPKLNSSGDNLTVVAPCKKGDKIYCLRRNEDSEWTIVPYTIDHLMIGADGVHISVQNEQGDYDGATFFVPEILGVDAFLSFTDAERKRQYRRYHF